MRMLYLECNAGASGDMMLGALAGLLDNPGELKPMLESAGIPGIRVEVEKGETFGIAGIRVRILVDGEEEGHGHHHTHRSLSNITDIIKGLDISDGARENAVAVYRLIAEAEAEAHGEPVDLVHFHEVGALDAVADIVGVCMLIEKLSVGRVIASPVRTGFGQVHCAHGMLPIPAPATASLLKGIPSYAGKEEGEFCTPTGAALLKHFASEFTNMPGMAYEKVGYGLGSKKFDIPNMLRAFIGSTGECLPAIDEIVCDIDDMVPEDLGGMVDSLIKEGALDASLKNCIMKKGRPGFELTCLCRKEDTERLSVYILAHTSTRGVRVSGAERYEMLYRFEEIDTEYGKVRVKVSEGFGIRKQKPEFEDIKKAAEAHGVSLNEVRRAVSRNSEESE